MAGGQYLRLLKINTGQVYCLTAGLKQNLSKLNKQESHVPQIKWLFSGMLLLPFSPSVAAHNQLQTLTWRKKRIDSDWQITDWLRSSRIDSWRRGGNRNRRAVYIILKTCDIHIPLSLHWSALVNACLIGEFEHYRLIFCLAFDVLAWGRHIYIRKNNSYDIYQKPFILLLLKTYSTYKGQRKRQY